MIDRGRYYTWLVVILVVALIAGFIDWPGSSIPSFKIGDTLVEARQFPIREGLDLRGGTEVLLEADIPVTGTVSASELESVRQIIERRVNGLGLTEAIVQIQGDRRILVEMPGVDDPETAIGTIRQTGFLEWVDVGEQTPPNEGALVRTDQVLGSSSPVSPTATLTVTAVATATTGLTPTAVVTGTPALTPTAVVTGTPAAGPTPTATPPVTETVPFYHTVVSGKDLDPSGIIPGLDRSGVAQVQFRLKPEATAAFAQFTAAHNEGVTGRAYYMCIVLDKHVISCPSIRSAIPDGQGVITLGAGGRSAAESLAVVLRYGALSVPLKVVENRTVGPTLGEDSIKKSIIAGVIGMLAVLIFMLLYYRLPGVLASLALLLYAAVTFALFKLIPVTLTLPGFAGFVLSVGVAVDANVLIFERMKEELRGGRRLDLAVEAGFARAWPSIRDSNISTLITCGILWIFGNAYGASIVKGFASTLALGVFVSLFTAITVTRTFLHVVLDRMDFSRRHTWFGI